MPDAEEVDVLGTLRTFIAAAAFPSPTEVLTYYPDAIADQAKNLVRLELVETRPTDWVGSSGPDTATPGKVDKTTSITYVVRVEAWSRRTEGVGAKSETQVSLEVVSALRRRLSQAKAALLQATKLHYVDTGRIRHLPFDDQFPDWTKAAIYFTGRRDEAWLEDP